MNACELRSDKRLCEYFRAEGEESRYYDAAFYGGGVTADGVLRARCDYWAGGAFMLCCGADLLCSTCRHWDESNVRYPELGERAGSMRVCRKGETTHSASWKPCWEPQTEQQVLEHANEAGRLF
jgi:hypothetical protein